MVSLPALSMLEAREAVVARMKKLGLLEKVESHTNRVGLSYRSKAVIEPFLSKQWFVKMSAFKQQLIDAVKHGHVRLIPQNWENTYLTGLKMCATGASHANSGGDIGFLFGITKRSRKDRLLWRARRPAHYRPR
jgi:Valyl-tRNA synthetase